MLRIEKSGEGQVLRFSGRIQADDIPALRERLEPLEGASIYSLSEVQIVDEPAVRILAKCETNSIILRHCAPYIGEWIRRATESR